MKAGMQSSADQATRTSLDDPALARCVAGGDRVAFEVLMRRHNRRLYRLARASLRNDAEAKDALQDAYICAYRSIGQFRGEASLATWLSRLVLNECNARLRRTTRRENIVSIVSADHDVVTRCSEVTEPGQSPTDFTARAQLRALLEDKIGQLPEIFRVVFVLRSIEEMDVEEVAELLAIAPETVRSRHFRARGMLRESLAREIDLAEGDVFEFGGQHCDHVVSIVLARTVRESGTPP